MCFALLHSFSSPIAPFSRILTRKSLGHPGGPDQSSGRERLSQNRQK
ncbi:hypothetical protein LptCag_2008 [Leptospirillum ferriphilum]|uniref:Uncharacterized protein n=1 Tax=Leptospirillum ferriphilum TaxID=178606 RepID=A0A094WAL5_9BACT|nr:hypothetical protein LptCag_2008 [Leptospirillum ferriphilum]